MKKFFYLSLLLSLLASCNARQSIEPQDLDPSANVFSPDESRVLASFSAPKTISKDQAIAFATFAASSFGSDAVSTKSGQRTIGDVSAVTEPSNGVTTKSGSTDLDTALYIVNYDHGNGFVLISAKSSSAGVLSFSPEGSLHIGDTIRNPGFALFLSRIEDYQAFKEAELKHLQDSLTDIVLAKINEQTGDETATRKPLPPAKEPGAEDDSPFVRTTLLSTTITKRQDNIIKVRWGQGNYENPNVYNRLTPNNSVAGCVPVAVAQIMAHHKQPAYYDNSYFDWTQMTRTSSAMSLDPTYQQQVSMLLENVGAWQNLRVTYGAKESGAFSEDVPRAMRNFGYQVPSGLMDYSISRIMTSLDANRPVYISGWAKETVYNWGLWIDIIHDEGHAWVIDGYYIERKYYETETVSRPGADRKFSYNSTYRYFVHCNMGWGGIDDKHYLSEVFDAKEASYYFRYKLKIIPDIYY